MQSPVPGEENPMQWDRLGINQLESRKAALVGRTRVVLVGAEMNMSQQQVLAAKKARGLC